MSALTQDPLAAEEVRARAREIVDGLHRGPDQPGWLERFLGWLDLPDFFDGMGEASLPVVRWVLYLACAAAVVGLIVWLVRETDWGHAQRAGATAAMPGGVREKVEGLLARAREARGAGDRLLALRLSFAAYVIGLSRRGDLDFRESWTNRELALRGAHTPALRDALVPLVDELDPLVYGGRPVREEHLDRLEGLCRGLESGGPP